MHRLHPRREDAFRPTPWLANPHLQTLWPALLRRHPRPHLRREALPLSDGDQLQLAFGPERDGPLVLLLHGLGGCADSGYIGGLIRALAATNIASVVVQFRGAGGIPNRADRFYHGGAYDDLAEAADGLRRRFPGRPLGAVGFSLGGSVLLNWLGSARTPLRAACAVSVPFDLEACAMALDKGFARVYQWDLVRALKRVVWAKFKDRVDPPVDLAAVAAIRRLWDFDDRVTAPLHGFAGAHDYYRRASCRQRLRAIQAPTLILHALDDPFVPRHCVPQPHELSKSVRLELSDRGGHVGFVAGGWPRYWLEERVCAFLRSRLHSESPQSWGVE